MDRITNQSLGTLTVEGARQILAECCLVAWSVQTFIDIFTDAIVQVVTFIAGANGLVVGNIAGSLATGNQITGFNTAIGGLITGPVTGAIIIGDTFHLEATHRTVEWITQVTRWTFTHGLVMFRLAESIWTTAGCQTWVGTFIIDAGQSRGAVLVLVTFLGLGTSLDIAITHRALGANTLE